MPHTDLPTILDVLNLEYPDARPIDGISLMDIIQGKQQQRGQAIGFQFRTQMSWVTDQYKPISTDAGETFELYDLLQDRAEQRNLAEQEPERVEAMKTALLDWVASCRRSDQGLDY